MSCTAETHPNPFPQHTNLLPSYTNHTHPPPFASPANFKWQTKPFADSQVKIPGTFICSLAKLLYWKSCDNKKLFAFFKVLFKYFLELEM